MTTQQEVVSEIAALDRQVHEHKQAIRHHRLLAIAAAEKRRELIEFCRRNGIPIKQA